ncbi:hypothetical protein GYMLUDRAFT_39254 [Collybiopsis luxurians FD-317 M1]|nr:hypothetical protein GYMLUDRAFT_39254 [Collybiopsis luxurians FD-317 M1]
MTGIQPSNPLILNHHHCTSPASSKHEMIILHRWNFDERKWAHIKHHWSPASVR